MADATALAAEIGQRFKSGDSADDTLARLAELLTRIPSPVPEDLRAALAELCDGVAAAVGTGDEWLADSGSAIAAERVRDRLNRAYGVPLRPE